MSATLCWGHSARYSGHPFSASPDTPDLLPMDSGIVMTVWGPASQLLDPCRYFWVLLSPHKLGLVFLSPLQLRGIFLSYTQQYWGAPSGSKLSWECSRDL